jgi:hypothetical protein
VRIKEAIVRTGVHQRVESLTCRVIVNDLNRQHRREMRVLSGMPWLRNGNDLKFTRNDGKPEAPN